MGFLIERIEDRHGNIGDLGSCQSIVKRLHSLGIVHGDLNRHNFIIGPSRTTLIDFENARKDGSKEAMQEEFARLAEQLTEETGRGSGLFQSHHEAVQDDQTKFTHFCQSPTMF